MSEPCVPCNCPENVPGQDGLPGPEGPTVVSSDPGNMATLGGDGYIFVAGISSTCETVQDCIGSMLNTQGFAYADSANSFTNAGANGAVLTSNGSGGAAWIVPATALTCEAAQDCVAPMFSAVGFTYNDTGNTMANTGVAGSVLTSNGTGGAAWVVPASSLTAGAGISIVSNAVAAKYDGTTIKLTSGNLTVDPCEVAKKGVAGSASAPALGDKVLVVDSSGVCQVRNLCITVNPCALLHSVVGASGATLSNVRLIARNTNGTDCHIISLGTGLTLTSGVLSAVTAGGTLEFDSSIKGDGTPGNLYGVDADYLLGNIIDVDPLLATDFVVLVDPASVPGTPTAKQILLTDVIASFVGTTAGTLAAGNDTRITGAAQKSANLSDLASAATARTNLGLGTAAVSNTGDFAAAAHTHTGVYGTVTDAKTEHMIIAIGDNTTAITTGAGKEYFRMPYAATITAVRASLITASSSGLPTFDIMAGGSSILSTKLSIDASEKTSVTAATPAVISTSSIADDTEMRIDVTVAGTGAVGAKIVIYYTRA